jgi:hypothetical protein
MKSSNTSMTKPITNPTSPASSNAPANRERALDWKAFSRDRALIVHQGPHLQGPHLLAVLLAGVELVEPTPANSGVPPVPPVPDRDLLLFALLTQRLRATTTDEADEVVSQPEASAPR